MSNKTRLHWKITFFLWLIVVTITTHMPAMEKSQNPVFIAPDKLFHFVSFGVLSFACWNSGWAKHRWTIVRIMIGWAMFDEITQAMLPLDRPFSYADLLASVLGIIAAASWMGALSLPQLSTTKEKVDALLSRTVAWVVFCPIAMIGTIVISGVVWTMLRKIYQTSYAPLSLCIGLLLTVAILLIIITIWCKIPMTGILVKTIPKMLGVGIIATLFGVAVSGIEVGAYTFGLTIFTIGCARVWYAVVGDKTSQWTM